MTDTDYSEYYLETDSPFGGRSVYFHSSLKEALHKLKLAREYYREESRLYTATNGKANFNERLDYQTGAV